MNQDEIRENINFVADLSSEQVEQITNLVLDSIQFDTDISAWLKRLEFSNFSTLQKISDSLNMIIRKNLQSRSASSDFIGLLREYISDEEKSARIGNIISSRLSGIVRDLAENANSDKLTDLEWRFGLTATGSSGGGNTFIQMRLQFENTEPVSVEMGMKEFYEFASDIKRIQAKMSEF